jgi:hypothetical protein
MQSETYLYRARAINVMWVVRRGSRHAYAQWSTDAQLVDKKM